jgi:hypothetical protein
MAEVIVFLVVDTRAHLQNLPDRPIVPVLAA